MPLINHTLKNITQGVSQQHDEARYETQVEEMINCIPDLSRGLYRRNPISTIASINDTTFNSNPNFFTYAYDRGDNEKYQLQINNNNQLNVIDLASGTTLDTFTNTYLSVGINDTYPNIYDSFKALTIGDVTFIVNRNKTTAMSSTLDGVLDSETKTAIYWIKDITTVETTVQTEGDTTSSATASNYEGYSYTLNGQTVQAKREYTWNATTGVFDLTVDILSGPDIATELARLLNIADPGKYAASGSYVYWIGSTAPTTWDWSDSNASNASFGFNGEVVDSSRLPSTIPDDIMTVYTNGLHVYVSGGSADDIGYWLKYTSSVGWNESVKPGIANTIEHTTMPYVLVRASDGNFYFSQYTEAALQTIPGLSDTTLGWKKRLYGDIFTSPVPSIIGSPITDIFFYQNRLGFISGSNIVLSGINNYGNMFPSSVRSIISTDVVDVTVASQEVSTLRYAIELADRLIIFADDSQFIVSAEGSLAPDTTVITVASKYNVLNNTRPIVVGDSAYFISTIGQSEHLFKYSLSEKVEGKFVATDLSLHTPTYLSNNTFKLVGHSTIGYTLAFEYNSNTIFVFNGAAVGEQQVQAAMHKWVSPLPIVGASIIDNSLYLSLYDSTNTKVILGLLDLNTPSDFTVIDYTDDIDSVDNNYTSYIQLSKWYVKDGEFGTKRGRLQIRTIEYSIDDNSYYTTEVTNNDLLLTTFSSVIQTGYWDDTLIWCDACPWIDTGYKFSREFTNDSKVTIMSNNESSTIIFKESVNEPTKGFNLKTINYEGFFYQRSQRY